LKGIIMPTDIDMKLADDLAAFRLETEKRFGAVETTLAGILEQLKFIRWIGVFFAGVLVTIVATSIGITWSASALNSEVKTQGQRLDKVEARLDAMGKQLDILISRTAPKTGG
jgi:hypothetical protein